MYLDANLFVFAAIESGPQGIRAREIMKTIENGVAACTSALVIDEVMWVLIRNKRTDILRETIEGIYNVRNLEVQDVPANVPLTALSIVENHKLRPRDAMHLAVMKHRGESTIVSDDKDFDRVPHIKRIKV